MASTYWLIRTIPSVWNSCRRKWRPTIPASHSPQHRDISPDRKIVPAREIQVSSSASLLNPSPTSLQRKECSLTANGESQNDTGQPDHQTNAAPARASATTGRDASPTLSAVYVPRPIRRETTPALGVPVHAENNAHIRSSAASTVIWTTTLPTELAQSSLSYGGSRETETLMKSPLQTRLLQL